MRIEDYTNPNLIGFWKTNPLARYRVLFGGRGSSKSHEFATVLVALMATQPIKVLCTRAFQNKISESVYTLLKSKISLLELEEHFTIMRDRIICNATGATALFYGLQRNTAEIKSLEGIDICWIEEGEFITQELFSVLSPTVRKEGSQIWITFNPVDEFGYVYSRFVVNKAPDSVVRKINYNDNPFISKTFIKEAEAIKAVDEPLYNHIYLGFPHTDATSKFFIPLMFPTERVKQPIEGKIYIGFDVADGGEDEHSIAIFRGLTLINLVSYSGSFEKSLNTLLDEIKGFGRTILIEVIYDSIGVGAGVGAFINSQGLKNVTATPFKNSHKVRSPKRRVQFKGVDSQFKNGDYFKNRKSQSWHEASEFFYTEQVFIADTVDLNEWDKLLIELCTPKKIVKNDLLLVESKEELAKRGVKSPNRADAFVMGLQRIENVF